MHHQVGVELLGVERPAGEREVVEGSLRAEPEAEGDVAELEVEVDDRDARARLRERDAEVRADERLARAAFRPEHADEPALVPDDPPSPLRLLRATSFWIEKRT